MTRLLLTLTLFAAACTSPEESAEVKPYPMTTCIVSGEELGSMGDPVTLTHDGQEYQFCCKNCVASFEKDPAKYAAKLDEQ